MATRTVLVVDDEPDDLQQMQKALEAEGYFVLLAEDYDSAMRMFQTHQASIDLLLTDIAIPGDNGCELAKAILSVRPEIQVLLVSGHTGASVCEFYGLRSPERYFIAKPFKSSDLVAQGAGSARFRGAFSRICPRPKRGRRLP